MFGSVGFGVRYSFGGCGDWGSFRQIVAIRIFNS